MPEQSKFEDVDLFASLNAVMKQNTGFYQSDLEIDKEIIAKAAASGRYQQHNTVYFHHCGVSSGTVSPSASKSCQSSKRR